MKRRATEGRIRPSYIAARLNERKPAYYSIHRGANSPLLHCGIGRTTFGMMFSKHRGANSPLLHCGHTNAKRTGCAPLHRGANSPLLHCGLRDRMEEKCLTRATEGRIRPSYIAAHAPSRALSHALGPPRGEFAPPTLRQEPRTHLRPHMRAPRGEFAPPTLRRGEERGRMIPRLPAPRGEFAPPTLRRVLV